VIARLQRHGVGHPVLEGLATVLHPDSPSDDPLRGAVEYKLPLVTLDVGRYDVEWVVTFESLDQATYPNTSYDTLIVSNRLT
jgi:hypothetical protein